MDQDLNGPQAGLCRVFKSHAPYARLQYTPAVKLVYCFRDLRDVTISAFKFMSKRTSQPFLTLGRAGDCALTVPPPSPPVCAAIWPGSMMGMDGPPGCTAEQVMTLPLWERTMMGRMGGGPRGSLRCLVEWWAHRHDENVCFVFYDDLKADTADSPATVRRMARFMEVEEKLSKAQIDAVFEQTTHKVMSSPENHAKFDDHRIAEQLSKKLGLPLDRQLVGKVRKDGGTSGQGKAQLSAEALELLATAWKEVVEAELGFKDLPAMRLHFRAELEQKKIA